MGRRLSACVLMVFLLTGCKPAQPIVPDTLLPEPIADEAPLPSYGELVRSYNETVKPLVRVWADARVDLTWLDENGKRKHEHGDGRFMFVSPDKVALEITEFDKGFWAGGDGERYWLFDMLQDPRTVYVGRYDNLANLDEGAFPLPVNPADLLYVLGLLPIDPDNVPEAPAVERVAGHYMIEPPGLGLRLLLHPETAHPVRVDILDKQGGSAVKCLLSEPVKLKTAKDHQGPQSVIASVVEVYVLNEDARMTLKLKSPTTVGTRIKDAHFDFDILMRVHHPQVVVDLDVPAAPAP